MRLLHLVYSTLNIRVSLSSRGECNYQYELYVGR